MRVVLLVSVLLRWSVEGQGPIGGDGGTACCPLITVSVGGLNANYDGEYSLKEEKISRPDAVCVNGCVYTKAGSPASDEYCFRTDDSGAQLKCSVQNPHSIAVSGILYILGTNINLWFYSICCWTNNCCWTNKCCWTNYCC